MWVWTVVEAGCGDLQWFGCELDGLNPENDWDGYVEKRHPNALCASHQIGLTP